MTTARRLARAAVPGVVVSGALAPPELLDPEAAPWQTNAALVAWLEDHDLTGLAVLPAAVRMHASTHPANRRAAAAEAWALGAGVLLDKADPARADWHALRAAGLLP